jgi:hypothetical protein
LATLEAFVLSKEAIIRKGMTRGDLYPVPQGMSATSVPVADAPPATADPPAAASEDHSAYSVDHPTAKLYTHGEVAIIALKAVQSALAAAIAQPQQREATTGDGPLPRTHTSPQTEPPI